MTYTELLPLTWLGDILRGHSATASSRKPSLINLPLGLGAPQTPGHILATTDKTDSIFTYFFVWLPWARILFHSLILSRILTHLRSLQMTGGIYEQINRQFGVSCFYSLFALQQRILHKDNASCSSFCSSQDLAQSKCSILYHWLIPVKSNLDWRNFRCFWGLRGLIT